MSRWNRGGILAAALLLSGVCATGAWAEAPAASHNETAAPPKAAIPTLREGSKARFLELHGAHITRGKQGPIGVLFLGDSITERWTSSPLVWKEHFGKWDPANFGVGGDRTQNLLWRITNGALEGISPKVAVIMIGTNNSNSDPADDIAAGIEKTVAVVREKLPQTKILLLAIFPREPRKGQTENPQMETIRKVNPQIAKLDDGKMVRYLDISDKFLVDGKVPKEIMPDGLHLSTKGYEIWAEAITPTLEEMMK